jgi:hypothetical protein
MNNNEKEHQEYLDNFLNNTSDNIQSIKKDVKKMSNKSQNMQDSNYLEYINVSIDMLPAGNFYKKGTQIKIRGAKVNEVQNYSVVDDNNYLDITEKMNEMLSSCVRYIHPDGSVGSYKYVKDADRIYLIFMIRELTFQRGNSLAKDVVCEHCKHEFKIPFRATPSPNQPRTFVNYPMPEELNKFYDDIEKVYKLVINDVEWKLAPPTIGIQEIFFGDIKKKVTNEKTPNVSFLKIIPYLLYDREKISDEGIAAKEKEFQNMDMDTFQILNYAVDKMKFGVEKLKMKCPECSLEVYTGMQFPGGASRIFVVSNPLSYFTKE